MCGIFLKNGTKYYDCNSNLKKHNASSEWTNSVSWIPPVSTGVSEKIVWGVFPERLLFMVAKDWTVPTNCQHSMLHLAIPITSPCSPWLLLQPPPLTLAVTSTSHLGCYFNLPLLPWLVLQPLTLAVTSTSPRSPWLLLQPSPSHLGCYFYLPPLTLAVTSTSPSPWLLLLPPSPHLGCYFNLPRHHVHLPTLPGTELSDESCKWVTVLACFLFCHFFHCSQVLHWRRSAIHTGIVVWCMDNISVFGLIICQNLQCGIQ